MNEAANKLFCNNQSLVGQEVTSFLPKILFDINCFLNNEELSRPVISNGKIVSFYLFKYEYYHLSNFSIFVVVLKIYFFTN